MVAHDAPGDGPGFQLGRGGAPLCRGLSRVAAETGASVFGSLEIAPLGGADDDARTRADMRRDHDAAAILELTRLIGGRRGLAAHDRIGFDDFQWMEIVNPGITAVAQPTVEMGRRAAQLLLRRMADPDAEPTVERLEPTLVVRGSTGAISNRRAPISS